MKRSYSFLISILVCIAAFGVAVDAQVPIDDGILNGKAKTLVQPKYPSAAVSAKASGAVKVKISVDEKGRVLTAEAVSGNELLRDVSLAAAKASTFTPHLIKGRAAKMTGTLVYNFNASTPQMTFDEEYSWFSPKGKKVLDEQMDFWGEAIAGAEELRALDDVQPLYDKGDFEGAVKALTAKINGAKPLSHHYFLRAKSYIKLYKNTLAAADIKDAIRLDTNLSVAITIKYYVLQGETLTQIRDYQNALASYSKVVELEPRNAAAYKARGDVYNSRLSKPAEALADYAKAIEINPKYSEAYMARGLLLGSSWYSSYDKAIADFSKVIELSPKDTFAYHQRGYTYYKLKKKAEALADFRKIVELDPKDKHAKHSIEALMNDRKVLDSDEYDELINGEKTIYYV